jgi:hypothetical protein
LRLLGRVTVERRSADAEARYAQASALATELGMRPLLAHCRLELGVLHGHERRFNEARAALGDAMAHYRALAMPAWLARAERELSALG